MTNRDLHRRTLLRSTTASVLGGAVAVFSPVRSASAQTAGDGEEVSVTYDVDTLPGIDGRIEVTITIELPDDVVADAPSIRWNFAGTDHELLASDGIVDGSSNVSYEWDRESTVGSATFRYNVRDTKTHGAGDDWALFKIWPRYPDDLRVTETFEQNVIQTQTRTLVGNFETHVVSTHGQELRVHVPDATEFRSPRAAVLDAFAYHVRNVRFDHREPALDVFIVPGKGGGAAAIDVFVGALSTGVERNTLGHEYVHTRQHYQSSTNFEMLWLLEGEARYMQILMSYTQGHIPWNGSSQSFLSFLTSLESRDDEIRLTDRDTWTGTYMNYYKGARALAALDQRIRDHTDGSATYQDVAYKRNRRYSIENDERFGYDDFVSLVEEVAGTSLQELVDETVDGTGSVPLPDDESLFPPGELEFDVQLAATAEFPGTKPTEGGESVFARVTLENVGADPSVAPTADVDWPDGWTLENYTISQFLADGEPETAVATPWTAGDHGQFDAQTFAPGDRVEIPLLLETDEPPTGTEALGVTVTDADDVTTSATTTLAEHFLYARLDVPAEVDVDSSVTLDASATIEPAGTEITHYTFAWEGHEQTTEEPTLSVSFSETGTHEVGVTVETADGQSDATTATLEVTEDDADDGCFITTATATEPATLDSLRRFRDESMATTPLGRALVELYYRISPPIADSLARNPEARTTRLTRWFVRRCATLSNRQAETTSPVHRTFLGVALTLLYVVGIVTAAAGHVGIRASESVGR